MQSRRTERHAAGRTLGKASRPCTCARHHAHGSSAEPLLLLAAAAPLNRRIPKTSRKPLQSPATAATPARRTWHSTCTPTESFHQTSSRRQRPAKAGWNPQEGNLDKVCPGKSIGGSVFYNDDGALPDAPGRTWHECDINYQGGHRGPERIVYSNDGLVYYTPDHYQTFEQLY